MKIFDLVDYWHGHIVVHTEDGSTLYESITSPDIPPDIMLYKIVQIKFIDNGLFEIADVIVAGE